MKVLRLRFKNLNSLVGEWEIDFTHPDYVSSGIFAITGPTGAGKTTILDAICLAFYGQTPRLPRISQTENETMSRQSGDCFAEVEFETSQGRFRCHWGQHRARRLAGGPLQAPRHEIVEAASGQVLESKRTAVAAKVEEVTGMDFDRFTRSMLLAQGGFAAFLQARPDDRAPILEQITGTEIYSQLSIKVHERTSEERRRLTELQLDLDGLTFLSPAAEESLRTEIKLRQEEALPLTAQLHELRTAQGWREQLTALTAELQALEVDQLNFTAKKAAATPDLERLAATGRALTLAAHAAQLEATRQQQQGEEAELQRLSAQLPRLQAGLQAAVATLTQAETALAQSRAEQGTEGELIRQTRGLDVQLGAVASQIQALNSAVVSQQDQCTAYQVAISQCEAQCQETSTELQEAAIFLATHPEDANLAEALTGIRQQLKALAALDLQGRAHQQQLTRQTAAQDDAHRQLQQQTIAWQTAAQMLTEAEGQLALLAAARHDLLQGRELSGYRDEAEQLATRQYRLQALQAAGQRLEETERQLTARLALQEALTYRQQALAAQEVTLVGTLTLGEEVCRQLQDKVVLLNRVHDLEAERAQLVDGTPCPLCGASDHPYARGNVPTPDEAQQELERARATAQKSQQELSAVQATGIGVGKDLAAAAKEQGELEGLWRQDQAFCQQEFAELGLEAAAASWSSLVDRERELGTDRLTKLRGLISQAEQDEQAEREAQTKVNHRKETLNQQDKARLAADLTAQNATRELARLGEETASSRQALALALAEVERALGPYGYPAPAPDQTEGLLAHLLHRRNDYSRSLQTQERLHKELAARGSAQEKQQALRDEAGKALADKSRQMQALLGLREGLTKQRLALYGRQDPDLEEKRLAAGLTKTETEREKALQGHNRLQSELRGLEQQVLKLRASIAGRGGQLAELEPAFSRRLTEAGFAEEAAFRRATMPPNELAALQHRAEALRQEETALQTRQQDRQAALVSEQEKRLTELSLDQLRTENAALSGQLTALQQGLGALQQQLQVQTSQVQLHQARLEEIKRQGLECARWGQLHALIGSSDGKKFRNFAQGLTFELMVYHANRQLQKMSDRYLLARDEADPLELNVIDNYQAGEIRSTKNLSGGESFIVSLALSLGLSRMASRTVRVDSLFLDEGFGTLDEDALETALETLSSLQQEGKLIGIISHVPALKERIGTQIQVETGPAGRSTLQGPGCRRVG